MMSVEILYKTTDITKRKTQAFLSESTRNCQVICPNLVWSDTQNEKQIRSKALVNL